MGDYEGTFVSWDGTNITILANGETLAWESGNDLAVRLDKAGLQEGDNVTVSVEFESYTAFHVVATDLQPRALLARIVDLERLVREGRHA